MAAPLTIESLYQQYAGRAPDAGGLDYWTKAFGDTIDPNEVGSFQRSVAENVAKGVESTATGLNYNPYFTANPDVAAEYMKNAQGLTPDQFAQTHYDKFGVNEQRTSPVIAQAASTMPATYDQAYVNQLVQEAATQAGGTLSYADVANAAKNLGISPEMINRALSTGVVTGATDSAYGQLVNDAYAGIGRTGIGTEASNVDQAGYDAALNALRTGAVSTQDFDKTFKNTVADYLIANPEDKYSTYVADYLQKNKNQDIAGIQQLYQEVLGRDADASGLGTFYKQFGAEISPEERAQFEQSAKGELDTRVKDLYTDFLGRTADDEGVDYWRKQFGSSIDDKEREQFRQAAASEVNKQFGVTDPAIKPTTEGVLSGFKYIKDSGIDEAKLKKTIGEDVFNTYKTGFSDYAKTGIANILADNKLSFDEASTAVKFGRDYGYDSQKLADLTGQKKELFDTINKSYDDTTNKIVDSVLGADDVKTEGDKIVRALALQQKYGFTDEDLAKAADYDVKKLKADLDPVRNYESDYKKTLTQPDVSGKDILGFLEKSKDNQGISTAYGSNIDGQIAKLKELDEKWAGFKDGYQAENIYNQVNAITKAANGQNWSGSWMGGGDNAAKEATRFLSSLGVDNMADLGIEKNYRKSNSGVEFYDGQVVRTDEDGRKYVVGAQPDGSFAPSVYLPKDAKTTPGVAGGDEDNYSFRPLNEQELKTYNPKTKEFDEVAGNKLIDKSTGKVIGTSNNNKFVLNRYETGNFFKSNDKSFGIMMTDKGVPVPYQTTQKGGLVTSPIFPIMLGMLAPGIGSMISGALPGAGVAAAGAAEGAFTAAVAPTLANTAMTQGIMGAGTAALTGQDPLKGALLGGIGAPISAGIGSLLPTDMNPNIARAITSGGTGVAKGLLQGGDFSDLLGQGVLSGLTNYGLGEVGKGLNLTPQQLNLATGIATPLLQGKNVNPMNLVGSAVQATR
jgi:hypothetical protein